MELYNLLYVFQLFALLGITGVKLYNIMKEAKNYEMPTVWLLFMGSALAYGMGFVIYMLEPEETFFQVFFMIETGAFVLNALFLFIELFYNLQRTATKAIGAYSSRDAAGVK
jgi:hypothetical protein